ncbi:hypothetical protein ACHAXH_001796 [Discostella pseudostelligera]
MERKRHLPMIATAVILLFVVGAIQQQQQQYSIGGVNTKSIRYFSNCTHGNLDDDYDDDAYSLAREQSFGFFYDITSEHWNLHRQLYLEHENHRYPDKPLTFNPQANEEDVLPEIYAKRGGFPGWSSYEAWYQNNYEPNFSCPFEMRVGEPMNGDGPKWVCDPHRITKLARDRKKEDPNHPGCVIYSIGSNGDFKFEMGMQNTVGEGVCEFHIFDFGDFEGMIPPKLRRAYYHRWGLKKQEDPTTKIDSSKRVGRTKMTLHGLQDTIKLLGHENLDVIDIFKIDCENCEWDTYMDWLSVDVPLLHQIQVEVHRAPAKKGTGGAIDFFDQMENAGYLRFHKEPNIQWGPDNVEYSFIKVEKAFMEGN